MEIDCNGSCSLFLHLLCTVCNSIKGLVNCFQHALKLKITGIVLATCMSKSSRKQLKDIKSAKVFKF